MALSIVTVPADGRYHLVQFEQYDVVLDLDTRLARESAGSTSVREMFPHQVRAEIARREALGEGREGLRMFWHKLFALPFACLIFAGLGPALGAIQTRSGRSAGYLLSIAGIFVYYVLLSASDALGEDNRLPPMLAAWLPNLCMARFCRAVLLRRHVHGSLRIRIQEPRCCHRWSRVSAVELVPANGAVVFFQGLWKSGGRRPAGSRRSIDT